MSEEVKEKTPRQLWVEALRSGKYRQGRHFLHEVTPGGDDTFCCLGVACDLYQKQTGALSVAIKSGVESFDGPRVVYRYSDQTQRLPPVVANWLGLTGHAGVFMVGLCTIDPGYNKLLDILEVKRKDPADLTTANDSGYTFEQIAHIIEYEPEGMFKE